ncbi:hypothetical protein CLAFUW4_13767 [Fulvia fulva]|uniref:Uncharacterized protein n=1 Tax=Passalora fulva TaxID=5499 RepID=A0A9Q8PLL7_PASFU|nr:uncharacterized protein CLAFUR5_13614 [Fulvia fulva]KAK4610369.1 hypothetical protein CLAFUR4_13770 [Fulvia fulva]KAK4611130.1 hypothetical protein CLAFUR0_13774 [Fulvia fulva]UJO24680.1 hypothetical protein CLAFUR5_13614 [Fulvia fulva]WPV22058.1 hypothetical protein CLAFUW4_13767 [Fulvia fulva]WPV36888.1 hypothetical protein CLAFUW7_13775 [Fulvia fulva]
MGSQPPPKCHLLELPGEIRNRIYRYSLLDSQRITIPTSGFEEPGLLSTCHQIRQEAEPIFVLENKFEATSINYHSGPLLGRTKKWIRITRQYKQPPSCGTNYTGSPSWPNYLTWMKRLHGGEVMMCISSDWGLQDAGLLGVERQLLATIADFVCNNKGIRSWDTIESHIERLHITLKTANPLWT